MSKYLYTVKDIATQMGVKEKTVRQLINSGQLKATKICNKWVITVDNLRELFAEKA